MALFGSSKYRRFKKHYADLFRLFETGQYESVIPAATETLSVISEVSDWPTLRSPLLSRELVVANCHILRAKCTARVYEQPSRKIETAILTQVFLDLSCAINLLRSHEAEGVELSLHNACFEFAELCVFASDDLDTEISNKALEYIEICKELSSAASEKIKYASALGVEADLYFRRYNAQKALIRKAIDCLYEALPIFESIGDSEGVYTVKSRLARYLLEPSLRGDPLNIEKAITYGVNALEVKPENVEMELNVLMGSIAEAYSLRTHGDRWSNLLTAQGTYEMVLEQFTAEENAQFWSGMVLDWADILYTRKAVRENLDIVDKRIGAVINGASDHNFERKLTFLNVQHRLSEFDELSFGIDTKTYLSELEQLQGSLDPAQTPFDWVDIEWLRISNTLDYRDESIVEGCVQRLISIEESYDLTQWPKTDFEISMNIGFCYFVLGKWEIGYTYAAKAMAGIFERTQGDFKGIGQQVYDLPAGRDIVRVLPHAALMAGDTEGALKYFDLIHSRTLAADMEDWLLIEKQVNMRPLTKDYLRMRMGERVVNYGEDASTFDSIAYLSKQRIKFDELKVSNQEWTRSFVMQHLDQYLPQINCWIFLPCLGRSSSRFVLIPPNSKVGDAYVSPNFEFGYYSELSLLIDENRREGWIRAIRKPSQAEHEFEKMRDLLWAHYGKWVADTLSSYGTDGQPNVCFITTGPLTFFPFAMAYDSQESKYLLDYMHISYMPSLYALISLTERFGSYNEKPTLALVNGKDDPDKAPFVPIGSALSANTTEFNEQHILEAGDYELSDVRNALTQSNHWHFAGHGSFSWMDAAASTLELADGGELRLNLLEYLEPGSKLRLVMLTACNTALQDFLNKDSDLDGFPNKLLSLGAFAVIGSLWKLQDDAGALISARFYHCYANQGLPPVHALAAAQIWLRDLTLGELRAFVQENKEVIGSYNHRVDTLIEEFSSAFRDDERPYADPEFWAGVVLVGL